MRFQARIFGSLALVGLLPAAVLGWLSFAVSRTEVQRSVGSAQLAVAQEAARTCEGFIAETLSSLRLSASVLPLHDLAAEERAAVLRIPLRQLESVNALLLLDKQGAPLAPPVVEPGRKADAFGDAELQKLTRAAPLSLALQLGTAIGPPYAGSDGTQRLPVALRLDAGDVLIAELSLRSLSRAMLHLAGNGEAYLATQAGQVLARSRFVTPAGDEAALLRDGGVRLVRDDTVLAAAAPVGTLGWTLVVAQPAAEALRPAELVRRYTIFWLAVALVLVFAVGALLARRVTEPVARLSDAVRSLTEGRAHATGMTGEDEFGQLGAAFDRMSTELLRRDEEIRRWNSELQARVDERTAELKTAQDQILRTRRLAALGSLGAGIAHEVNNPLTAISGLAALLRKELAGTPHEEQLKTLQEQTRRVARIVGDLRQFADQERNHAGRRFALAQPVQAALELYDEQLRAKQITVHAELRKGVREAQGDPLQIQQVVAHLVQNAIQAMPAGGDLRVAVDEVDGDALKVVVSDSGKGIPAALRERIFDPFFTTKDAHASAGLGLSISHSIVEAHHGRLLVESTEGHGATFTIVLPAAAAAAHLS